MRHLTKQYILTRFVKKLSKKILKKSCFNLNLFKSLKKTNILVRKTLSEPRVLPCLKKEGLLKLNTKIDFCLNNKKTYINIKPLLTIKDLYSQSFLIYSLRKHMILRSFGFQKQYFYRLIDIVLSLSKVEQELFSNEIFSFFGDYKLKNQNNFKYLNNIVFKSIFNSKFKSEEKNIYANLA